MTAPVVLSRGAIAWACAYKRRILAAVAACPMCGKSGRVCLCTPRDLAEFRARQGSLPGIEEHIAPALPAKVNGQGRLF
jgi:hypothetical protein